MKAKLKEFSLVVLTSCIVGAIFLIYMALIGIPKTQARNFYNKALLELEDGNFDAAKQYLEDAKKSWDEAYLHEKVID